MRITGSKPSSSKPLLQSKISIEYQRWQLEEIKPLVAEQRQELLAAARERKIIEKLKEKQLAEYLNELDRKERIMLDEISLRQRSIE